MPCNDGSHSEEYWEDGACRYCGARLGEHSCRMCGDEGCDCPGNTEEECEGCTACLSAERDEELP